MTELNSEDSIHGIVPVLPLPEQIDQVELLSSIDPAKDVDSLHPETLAVL